MNKCPCGSFAAFSTCCEPFITFKKFPRTAEALMRARYTAYVKGAIDFIEKTHSLEKRDNLSVEETRKWAEDSEWLGLEIIRTEEGLENDSTGTVEFKATFIQKNIKNIHHEVSTFYKAEGQWYFQEGKIIPTTVTKAGEKVGRNDPCPCGSEKKYKKCCL